MCNREGDGDQAHRTPGGPGGAPGPGGSPHARAGTGEIRIRVSVCGVCHTEIDEIEGRTAPAAAPGDPGHQVVGRVDRLGPGATRFRLGDRVGVGWIYASSGAEDENLSPDFRATGRDADGGYAEYMTVPEDYAYPIPAVFTDAEAAPCSAPGPSATARCASPGLETAKPWGSPASAARHTSCSNLSATSTRTPGPTSLPVTPRRGPSPWGWGRSGQGIPRSAPRWPWTPSSTPRRPGPRWWRPWPTSSPAAGW